jgi:hypothetical protein
MAKFWRDGLSNRLNVLMVISCDVLMANFQQNYVSILYMFIYLFILMLYDITSVCLVVKNTPVSKLVVWDGSLIPA